MGANVNDIPSNSVDGSKGAKREITITLSKGFIIQNKVEATPKLAGASIPPSHEKEIFAIPASVLSYQA